MSELIIVFREVLEGSLIVGILYTFLKKSDQVGLINRLWQGVICALIASLIGSFLFQMLAGGFVGNSSKIFEGLVMILASIVLGSMIVWMAKNKNVSKELSNKAEIAISESKSGLAIFSLSFISVFREGIETILFLYGIAIKQGGLSISLSLLGVLLGLSVSFMIFIQGKKVPIKQFFDISSRILIFVASGMLAYGVHELESGGVIPDFGRLWDVNPMKNTDGTYPLFHDKGLIGGLMKGLFGYNGNPSLIEFLVWSLSIIGLNFMWIRTSK